ncbi:MAG TPA: hypothetical protein VKG65_06060 [Terriglobales bacterium]|nr:hypothetical protein [Terriglobales bacterium]
MAKTEVYSWRVDPQTKMALESEARSQGMTLAGVLDRLAKQWLEMQKQQNGDDEAEQARLHAAAAKCFGTLSMGDPRGSEKVRETVRKRLQERYGR